VVVGLLTFAGILAAVCGAFALSRRRGWVPGLLAWRLAQGGGVAFLVSVLVYQKPASFYTNFVILPAMLCFTAGLLCLLATVLVALIAFFTGAGAKRDLQAIGLVALAMTASFLVIFWRAS
jgi:hypothetical protein